MEKKRRSSAFLNSALNGGEWSGLHFRRFTPGKAFNVYDPGWAQCRPGHSDEIDLNRNDCYRMKRLNVISNKLIRNDS
jgi:hypothetical protein